MVFVEVFHDFLVAVGWIISGCLRSKGMRRAGGFSFREFHPQGKQRKRITAGSEGSEVGLLTD